MSAEYAIGIDIGATNTKIGLVQLGDGAQLIAHQQIPSNLQSDDPGPFLAAACAIVDAYARQHAPRHIGISLCSIMNADHTGAFLSVNAPALNHLNIQQVFAARFGCPAQVMNDVNAYALAEYHYGAGRGTGRLLCVAFGTGVAIACINMGRMIETWAGVAADAGRIVLDPASEIACNGGVRGSAEALCGTAHIVRLAQQRYRRTDVTARDVITAARAGSDPIAAAIIAEIGAHAGHLLAILSPVFFPQRIVITGGSSEAGEALFRAARERYAALIGDYMANLAMKETGIRSPVEICKGALGPDAAILGSVLGI